MSLQHSGLKEELEWRKSNILRLAIFCLNLPPNYDHFDMVRYCTAIKPKGSPSSWLKFTSSWSNVDEMFPLPESSQQILNECGTVACFGGHGPAAGIEPTVDEEWQQYITRVFTGRDSLLWCWLFDGEWNVRDNTHHGAAIRAFYYLAKGVPELFDGCCTQEMVNSYMRDWKNGEL